MKMNATMKRFLSLVLVLSVLLGWALPANALDTGISFRQVSNDSIYGDLFDRDPVDLQEDVKRYEDSDPVRVSIILEEAGTIEAGYDINSIATEHATMKYRSKLKSQQDLVIQKIESTISEKLDVVWQLTLGANLISANTTYGNVDKIAQIKGVKAVIVEEPYEPAVVEKANADPNMATSGVQTGAPVSYAAGYTGAGSRIAVIDTGADVSHLSFDSGAFDYSLGIQAEKNGLSTDEYLNGLDLLDAAEIAGVLQYLNISTMIDSADDLYVNSKIPFGFNYVDEDLDITHLNDGQGEHGSHVAGIATANSYVPKSDGTYEDALGTVGVQGVAPDAQLIVMKVFGKGGGAYDSDYMAAIEDAIILGADSINLSLGSGAAGMTYSATEAYELIMDSLVDSGVVVCMSAGNNSYWSAEAENGLPYLYLDDVNMQTGGSPGSYTNSLGIASVDNAGYLTTQFVVGDEIAVYLESLGYGIESMATLSGDVDYVFLNGIGEGPDFDALGVSLEGKLVLCYRGTTSFFEKANAAVSRGAKAVAIVNNQEGGILLNLTGYEYNAPVVSLYQAGGEIFKNNGTPILGEDDAILGWTGTATIDAGRAVYDDDPYYTMSSFSSWGAPGDLSMKPEITAPGGSIYSVAGANYYEGQVLYSNHASYEVMSGTSMASPQVAGMAALVAQYIREEGLEAKTGIDVRALSQSLLMSTATPLLDGNSGGNYYPVLQQGAGLANVGAVVLADSYLMMAPNANDSYADGKIKVELGDDPNKAGQYTFTFYINNLTNEEKTYLLSADFFTQGAFAYSGILLMDTWTQDLAPNVTWMVNGKTVDSGADLEGMDFNGDGYINSNDGQAILDYAIGAISALENAALADIDKDSDVDSHDAYLFFQLLGENGAVVPANGSTEVQVTVTLTANDKAWLANYENGAYLEGYVYAETMATDEGVAGTCHSIPVLGFYGNWSDASMYDKGSYVEYAHGEENRPPYLYSSNYQNGNYNGFTVSYSDDPSSQHWFGGNPYITDDKYMPERNAINSADTIKTLGFSLIRNAAAIYLYLQDSVSGGYYLFENIGEDLPAAYYYPNGDVWKQTFYTANLGLNFNGLPSGTSLDLGIISIPEYYLGKSISDLGDGAYLSIPMTIDNDAPVLENVKLDTDNKTLEFTVKDNQYIAAVALFDAAGQNVLARDGSKADQKAGDTVTYTLDVSNVNGNGFLLQAYDYACNAVTYELDAQIGEVVDTVESITISESSLIMQKGNSKTLSASVLPLNAANREVLWSSSDDSIVSVDANGKLTANAVGTATITAAAAADESITASCAVEVIDISADLNGIVWDEMGSIWFSKFNTSDLPNYTKLSPDMLDTDYFTAAAVGADGTLYASTLNTSTSTGSLYTIDPVTYEATFLADCVVQNTPIFYSDLTYVPAMFGTGVLLGTYGPYVIAIDPASGEALGIIDQFDSDLVGITTCYGQYDPEEDFYQDVVYLIQNDGTVIQEIYFGYEGLLGVYSELYNEGVRIGFDSGVDVGAAWYFNSAYYDGDYLYWSAFDADNENAVTLYAIDADYSGNVYNMGQFDEGVWPIAGLYQMASADSVNPGALPEIPAGAKLEMKEYDLAAYAASKEIASIPGKDVASPMSSAIVDKDEGIITMDVTAGDLQAAATDIYNNGVISVEYDAEALELQSIIVNGDYTATKKEAGKVIFGYVDLDGVAPDTIVATLLFNAIGSGAESAKVTYLEANNEKPNVSEDVEIKESEQSDDSLVIDRVALSLESYVGAQFVINTEAAGVYDSIYVVIEHETPNGIVTETLNINIGGERYIYEYKLAAKQMNDKVTATTYGVKDGITYVGPSKTWSVRQGALERLDLYYEWIEKGATEADRENYKKRCVLSATLLAYGAEAQKTFGYNSAEENLVTYGVDAKYLNLVPTGIPSVENETAVDNTGFSSFMQYSALMAESNIQMSMRFKLPTTNPEDYEARIVYNGGTAVIDGADFYEVSGYADYWTVVFDKLPVKEARQVITIAMYEKASDTAVSPEYSLSIENVAYDKIGSNAELVYTLMRFSDAAKALFG